MQCLNGRMLWDSRSQEGDAFGCSRASTETGGTGTRWDRCRRVRTEAWEQVLAHERHPQPALLSSCCHKQACPSR